MTEHVTTEIVVTDVARPGAQDGIGTHWSRAEVPSAGQQVTEADQVAAIVLAVPGVAGLHGGAFGEVATYLPGRRVTGVRIDPAGTRPAGEPARIEVHVVARYPARVAVVAEEIRSALTGPAGGRVVDVVIEDYAAPQDPFPETGPAPTGP